jgi:surfeit locus 1 family protein
MADSSKASADYARSAAAAPTAASAPTAREHAPRKPARRFQPRLWPTLAAAVLVAVCLAAGQWQWDKASGKTSRQQQLDARAAQPAIQMPTTRADAQSLLYRKVVAHGHYEPQQQILIDNRTYRQQAGYHVITPLRVDGSEIRLLINRGWVPALADHRLLPQVATPSGRVEVSGTAIVPGTRFFTLGADSASVGPESPVAWQNLDLDRYGQAVGFPIQPVVIELDADSAAGGFVREWRRPDDRLQTNLNYAMQWWGFAATTVALWLVVNFRRR